MLLDLIWPRFCVGCGKIDEDLCGECLSGLEYADQICPGCGKSSVMGWKHKRCKRKTALDGLISVYSYKDEVLKKVVEGFKFGFNKRLAEILVDSWDIDLGRKFDEIVPVPLYFYRENWRGFNQAEFIGLMVQNMLEVDLVKRLRRKRKTEQFSLGMNKNERRTKIAGVFEWVENGILPKRVLLIDDVFTSGATMNECAKVLKNNGVEFVWGLTLAH